MSERDTGNLRVAWGDYDWRFTADGRRATKLLVLMRKMVELPAANQDTINRWLADLPAPWCEAERVLETVPSFAEDADLRAFLTR